MNFLSKGSIFGLVSFFLGSLWKSTLCSYLGDGKNEVK